MDTATALGKSLVGFRGRHRGHLDLVYLVSGANARGRYHKKCLSPHTDVQPPDPVAFAMKHIREPILITRRGRIAGVFFPAPNGSVPIHPKQHLAELLSSEIARRLKQSGTTEEEVLARFELWRKTRGASRRQR